MQEFNSKLEATIQNVTLSYEILEIHQTCLTEKYVSPSR